MKRLLIHYRISSFPYGCSPRLSTFADQEVTLLYRKAFQFRGPKEHLRKIIGVNSPPTDINVPQIRHGSALSVFSLIEHLAKSYFSDLSEIHVDPPLGEQASFWRCRRNGLLVLSFASPGLAAGFLDSREELGASFVVSALPSRQFCLRRHQPALARRLQHRGTVGFQFDLG